jgi:hypothetical protein
MPIIKLPNEQFMDVLRSILLVDSVRSLTVNKNNVILTLLNVESLYPLLGRKYYYHPILAPGVSSFDPTTALYCAISRLRPEIVLTYDIHTKDLSIKCCVNSYDFETAVRNEHISNAFQEIRSGDTVDDPNPSSVDDPNPSRINDPNPSSVDDPNPRKRRKPAIVYTIRAKRTRNIETIWLQKPTIVYGEPHRYLGYVEQTLYATDGLTKGALLRCLDGFKRKEDVNEIFIVNLNLKINQLDHIKNINAFCEKLYDELQLHI